jgi:DNA-directed RNA polymerase beta subunit
MPILKNKTRYLLSDFVEIQRRSFYELLKKGLIEEFTKRNPITNSKKTLEIFFYPEYYKLTLPENSARNALLKEKSYTSKLYIPVQLSNKILKTITLKWVCIGNLPLMTKRGHFILNGAPRIIVNQILRSPGLYYQQKTFENFKTKWDSKPHTSYKRYYADLICQRGTWLRLEIDKEKCLWAQMKKGPKIPLFWFLVAMGLTEKMIFNTVSEPSRLLANIERKNPKKKEEIYNYVKNPPEAWDEIYSLITMRMPAKQQRFNSSPSSEASPKQSSILLQKNLTKQKVKTDQINVDGPKASILLLKQKSSNLGRKWIFNKFMNPRTYDLGKIGRININKKLGISITPTNCTLTPQDLLYATDYLIKVEQGLKKIDDIDHLKNRRVRTSGELLQIQIGTGLIRLEKEIRQKMSSVHSSSFSEATQNRDRRGLLVLPGLLKQATPSNSSKQSKPSLPRVACSANGSLSLLHNTSNQLTKELGAPLLDQSNSNSQCSFGLHRSSCFATETTPMVAKKKNIYFRELWRLSKLKQASSAFIASQPSVSRFFRHLRRTELYRVTDFATKMGRVGFVSLCLLSFGIASGYPHKQAQGSNAKDQQVQKIRKKRLLAPSVHRNSFTRKRLTRVPYSQLAKLAIQKRAQKEEFMFINQFINTKAWNSSLREFFGSSPLSQFMDQINPLSELTHKRRLTSMGPGGVSRDSATLAIRGIHPTHYGRICPIETPEGKNTGLVNSMTTFARVNSQGFLQSPFYLVYKGQVQKKAGMFYFSADQEEKMKTAAPDITISYGGFLPSSPIPVKIAEDFTKINRNQVQYIGVSPLQMISVATSLIPFLEHDDANRALMGSNMQRQAVPLIRPEKPIVGTGLEGRAVSDSGHALQAKASGFVRYVSGKKIVLYSYK